MQFKSKFIVVFLLFLFILALQKPLFAQDEGEPVMKSLTYYSIGGAAAGSVLGLLYFLTDPMAPSRNGDPKPEIYSGFGIGSVAGVIFGVTQLSKQAVRPGREVDEFDEFDGNVQKHIRETREDDLYAIHSQSRSKMRLTIFSLQYKF